MIADEIMLDRLPPEQPDIHSIIESYCAKRIQAELKRGLDLVVAVLLVVVLSPLLCLVALLVRLEGDGTIIYKRRVIGKNGEFYAYKFRTMCKDADQRLAADHHLRLAFEQNFKLAEDPRVTKVGAFLRKYSLDELPQFINVIKGEMSLVGPRMVTSAELGKYGALRELMLRIKPGITGYWQVNGRQNVSYDERIRMDTHYVRNWTLLLDIYILCKTPFKVIKGEGAY
jgi:lipopolysaccharide/colanic/teichoic acid biosynthesis glycosyltransferase